jgi:O-acetylserine/cysteine efflux transporter
MGVLHFSMMFIGLNAGVNIAAIAITTQLYVPFSAIFAAVFLKEYIAPIKILAIVIAFLGILIIGFDPIVFNHLDAVLWVIGAALAFSVGTIQMRQFPNMGILKLQAWIALVASPSLLLLSLFFETGQMHILLQLKIIDLWTPLYSALGASVIGHSIVYYLLGRYPVSTVTPLMLLAPVIASLFGVWCFDDQIGWKLFLGGFLTLTGVLLVSLNIEKLRHQLAQYRKGTRQGI